MADELDDFRLRQVEEISSRNATEIGALKQREAVRDVEVKALKRSNDRYAAALMALVVAVVSSAAAIIVAGGGPS
jgi:hypothetical protein